MKQFEIMKASIEDLDSLVYWRMEVLKDVFSISPKNDMSELERYNREYYKHEIPLEGHIACFVLSDRKKIGCGGICIYDELPSPDNPSGKCAYLMNIYVRPEFRHNGVGRSIIYWLIEQAQKKEITKIYLETSTNGRNMYQNIGFENMQDMMIYKKRTI